MTTINRGDIVKSLDFNGVEDCYMIGKVISVSKMEGTFRAKLIKRVWQGSEDQELEADYFTAPQQGKHMFDNSKTPRVVVVG